MLDRATVIVQRVNVRQRFVIMQDCMNGQQRADGQHEHMQKSRCVTNFMRSGPCHRSMSLCDAEVYAVTLADISQGSY